MHAKSLLFVSLLALAAAVAHAQSYYATTPIAGAPSGYQRVVFTPVIDIANGIGTKSCYTVAYCNRTFYDYLFVTPCPDGKPCGANGYYTKSFGSFASCPNGVPCGADTLDLTIGTQYSFFGNWTLQKWMTPCDGCSCQDIRCEYNEDYATGTYPGSTPAARVGWGTVRVRYR
jgi:hypothetical protein